jgi:integrase/recombinase XerD
MQRLVGARQMTTTSRGITDRRCKPVAQWPQRDRLCWEAALQPGDWLEPGGGRAQHSRYSNRAMEKGYGRWLAWLDGKGWLDNRVAPGDRITPDRVRTYVADLEAENASGTVVARLIELKVMAGVMDPGRDWSWIYRIASSIRARHQPARPKRHRLVDITRLFDLGIDLMAEAENQSTRLRRFKAYRDGLMIALLASRPLRLRNLTGLALDRTLVRRGDTWWVQIPAAETKTKEPIELPWPEFLAPHLETYLADHRAGILALRGSGSGTARKALWLSMYGAPMNDNAIYTRIVARTREGLGQPIYPHLFRDCAATSIAINDPAHVGIASRLLAHRTGSTTERYYNQARSVEASRLMQKHLLALRNGGFRAVDPMDTIQ